MRHQNSLLLVFLTLITTACFTYFAVSDCLRDRTVCFGTNTANQPIPAPFRYRVLEPTLTRLLNPSRSQDGAVLSVIALQGLFTALTLPCLYMWLKRWMNDDRALIGVMLYCFVELGAYHMWYLSLGTTIEAACVVLALVCIDRKWYWIAPIVIVASFNRETALIIVAIYGAWHWRNGFKPFLVLFALWVGITAGLHIVLGSAEHVLGLLGTLQLNLSNWLDVLLANLILAPLYWLILRGFKGADVRLRRLALVGGLYLVAIAVGGSLGEVQRLILPVLPLLIPFALNSPALTKPSLTQPPHKSQL